MTKRDYIIIDLAVRVLRAACADAAKGCVDTAQVRLALHCLRGRCPDAALADFWKWARQLPNANRADNCTASLQDLLAALEAAGTWPGDQTMRRRLMAEELRRFRDDDDREKQSRRAYYWRPPRR